jgi:predicted ATPase
MALSRAEPEDREVTPERYGRIEEIFHTASELQGTRRRDFLVSACAGDDSLLRDVESLLEAGVRAGGFLATSSATAQSGIRPVAVRIPPGRQMGHYVIDSFIGAGGMGHVYLAIDARLGRKVALKVLPAAPDQASRVARFESEARAASALNHPNIVSVFDIGIAPEGRYIVMEHVAGRTLREMLSEGPLTDSLHRIGGQLARALRVAHEGGIVHRDIKPENVMIRHDGFIKVLDFGLARLFTADEHEGSIAGAMIGTPRYMSPEQALGEAVQAASDIFSLGIVFYEMATGRHPFASDSMISSLHAILTAHVDPPSVRNREIGTQWDDLILAMLARDESKRPRAADVEAALEAMVVPGSSKGRKVQQNLPSQRTPFLGRETELAAIAELLHDPNLRLITLIGPGGTGKTRLALKAAENAIAAFPSGVFFVDLAPLTEASMVVPAIAKEVGVREGPGQDLLMALASQLSTAEPVLLVLDNFEHVLGAGPRVASLLERCPSLRILNTSRVPLRLYGEREFVVEPLALPAEDVDFQSLAEFSSVALFAQRAAGVRPGFHLTVENGLDVAAICRRLDGLPLAIELAASRVKLLSPAALRSRMEKSLDLLTGGGRDLPARQQTLRNTIDWSHELLSAPEQKLFARLSVFLGGCTLESAEAVCNTREDLGIDVMEGMASLVDHGLVRQEPDEEPRFVLLETIREYAQERLSKSGERKDTERAHAAFFVVYSEDISSLDSVKQQEKLAQYQREYANSRAALRWLIGAGEAEWALRLSAAQTWFWDLSEQFSEAREMLETVLRMPEAQEPTAYRARTAYLGATQCYRLGDFASSVRYHADGLSILRRLGDRTSIASVLIGIAMSKQALGRCEESRMHLEEAIAIWRELGDDVAADYSLSNLAQVAKAQGDYPTAKAVLEPLVHRLKARGDRRNTALALSSLGDIAAAQGDIRRAGEYQSESLAVFTELNDATGQAMVLADLGQLARNEGRFAEARSRYRESLRKAVEAGRRTHLVRALTGLAECALNDSDPAHAAALAAFALSQLETVAASGEIKHRKAVQEVLERCRAGLDPSLYAREMARCRRMTFEQAIAYVLNSS